MSGATSEKYMAEREGFEPPVAFRLRLISSQVHSTGLCHLSEFENLIRSMNEAGRVLTPSSISLRTEFSASDGSASHRVPIQGWTRPASPLVLKISPPQTVNLPGQQR